MSLCGEGTLLADGVQEKAAVTRRCKCWTCDNCVDGRRTRLKREAERGNPSIFLTLTTRRLSDRTAAEEARLQSKWFAELMRRMAKRTSRKRVQFLIVRESHKSGWPHMHVLIRGPYVPWQWIRAEWLAISGSDRINVKAVNNRGHAAGYIASYVKKAPAKFGNLRRYWMSQDYLPEDDQDDQPRIDFGCPWERRNECIITFAERWSMEGWTVAFEGPDRVHATGPPGATN